MRRHTLAFVAVASATTLAFAPFVPDFSPPSIAEMMADPLAAVPYVGDLDGPASAADDLPGPGDLVHSVENVPGGLTGQLDPTVDSAEGLERVAGIDVLGLVGTTHPSIPGTGTVRGGAAGDLGTFVEFFSPTVIDADGVEQVLDVAVVGVNDMGALLIDVTDPTAPELLSILNCGYHQADVGVQQLEDGRWVVGIGADDVGEHEDCLASPISPYFAPDKVVGDGPQEAIVFFDVTDLRRPVAMSAVTTQDTATGASHTIEFHPSEPLAYIATALDPRVEIVDYADPAAPRIVGSVDTPGNPHAVRVSDDGQRFYSAGSFAQNLSVHDISDPLAPVPVAVSTAPRNIYTHEVLPTHDRGLMLIMDEGAFDPGYDSGYCPGTGFWIYDMTVEHAPVPLSYTVAEIDQQTAEGQACAVHYGNVSHDDAMFTVAYYGAGVRVFDISDPLDPVEVGHAMYGDSDVWTAKSYRDGSYVFVSDLNRGFEVFRWTGEGSLADLPPAE